MKRCAVFTLALLLVLLLCPASAEDPPVTRSGFLTLLWCTSGTPEAQAPSPFTDVSPQSLDGAVSAWAFETRLTYGTGGSTFSPGRVITREETAVLLRRYARQIGRDDFFPDGPARCNDYQDLSPWADDSLYWATMTGLLEWSPGGRMDPGGSLTSQNAADALYRLLERG